MQDDPSVLESFGRWVIRSRIHNTMKTNTPSSMYASTAPQDGAFGLVCRSDLVVKSLLQPGLQLLQREEHMSIAIDHI